MRNKEKTACFSSHSLFRCGFLVFTVWLLVLAANNCSKHDPDRYIFSSDSSVRVDRLFTLSVDGSPDVPADGFSAATLVAQILIVTEGPRRILFTTSAGNLRIGSETFGDSAFVETNLQGRATVDLVSTREVGTARVIARVIDVTPVLVQETTIRFIKASIDSIITFVESPDSAFASSAEITPFTVRISPALRGSDRKVTFTTTQGEFVPAKENTQTRIVEAGDDNLASVQLRSPDNVTEALITAVVRDFTRETTIHFVSLPADSVIWFTEASATAPADGATLTKFAVTVSPVWLGESNPTVEFETNQGNFASSSTNTRRIQVAADSDHKAKVYLQSPNEITQALVTATAKEFKQSYVIEFTWAAPDTILLFIDSFQLRADDQTYIVAEMVRHYGRGAVTIGTELTFQAADSLGNNIEKAKFFNLTRSDMDGKASAYFTPDGTPYRGLVTITARPAMADTVGIGQAVLRIVD